ncbi:MAG: nucleotidyltransferase domain-containing protein [Bacteroidales bacterium]|nr:nucleotidyltransferase domain-containing protein [Bacteroidales bacterium]
METVNLILTEIKSTVRDILPGAEIILFGSRARNDNQYDSDYDLLIIVEFRMIVKEKLKYQALIRKNLAHKNILADIILQSKEEVKIKKKLLGHIVHSAILEGIPV